MAAAKKGGRGRKGQKKAAPGERAEQIKKLLAQDKDAGEIAAKLGITRNAVYQQIRRMRGGKKRAAKGGRKSTRKAASSARRAPAAPAPAPTPAPAEVASPTEVLRIAKRNAEEKARDGERHIKALEKEIGDTRTNIEDAAKDAARFDAALTALAPAKRTNRAAAKKRAPAAKKSGSGTTPKDKPDTAALAEEAGIK